MAADGRVVIDVVLDDGSVERGLDNINGQFSDLDRNGSSRLAKIGGGIKSLATVAAVGATAVVGIGAAIGGLAAPLVQAAAGAQAMNAQFEQVFGELQKQAQSTVDTLGENFGMMPERIKPAFTQMTSMFKGLGLDTNTAMAEAEKAVTAVADAAAFYDLSFNDANSALNSFIKGNYEGGEAIGLFANETQMASYAMKEGLIGATKEWASLDEATKQATRLEYALAMQNMAGATGQATRESDSLENQLGNLNQAWENLKALLGAPLLEPAIQGIKLLTEVIKNFDTAPFTAAFSQIKTVVSEVITAIREYFNQGLSNLQSVWAAHGETILNTVQTAFDFVVTHIQEALNVIVPFVQEQLVKIQQFWSENGKQIVEAVTNFLQGAKAVFDFVLPAILAVVEYIWNAIKNVITGALDIIMGVVKVFSGLFTGDFSKMWEGIKQIFSGAIDLIIGLMSLSFVGGIRTLVTNLAKMFVNAIKTKWTSVVNLFKNGANTVASTISSWVGKLIGFVKNLATNFTTTITTLRTSVVTRFKELSTQVINAVKDLPGKFLQMGKDVVTGFINGIKGMANDAVKAIGGVMDSVIETAAGILGWASPAKVFIAMGSDTIKGYAIGLKKEYKSAEGAMQDVLGNLIDVAEHYSSEQVKLQKQLGIDIAKVNTDTAEKVAKIQDSANTKIANIESKAKKKKRSLTVAEKAEITKIEKDSSNEITKLKQSAIERNAKLESAATKNSIKALEDSNKEYLATVRSFIDDKKSLDQLNIIDEVKIWEKSISLFEEGTKERIEAQKAYQKSIETINSEIVSKNNKYISAMQKIDDDYVKQSADKTKEYVDEFKKREQSLVSFAGTFDEFAVSADVTGAQLLSNLKGQVKGFEDWKKEIENLSSKAIDEGLLAELQNMGPKALAELRALNSLSESQLTEYSNVYAEKAKQARERTEKELAPMKKEMENHISDLRKTADSELSKLETEWVKEIKAITKGTANELKTLESIGEDAVRGLITGMESMHEDLRAKAKAIGVTVAKATADALKVKSPSRVMMEIGKWTVEGMIRGINSKEEDAKRTAENMASWFVPETKNLEELKRSAEAYATLVSDTSPEKISLEADEKRVQLAQKYADIYKELQSQERFDFAASEYLRDGFGQNRANELAKQELDKRYTEAIRSYEQEKSEIARIEKEKLSNYENFLSIYEEADQKYRDAKLKLESDYIAKSKALNQISLQEELALYEEFLQQYETGTQERIYYEKKIGEVRQEILKDTISETDKFGDALMDALEKKYELRLDLEIANSDSYYDSIINPLKEAEKILDKQFAEQDRTDTMSGLQRALSKARTEADRKRIQQQIDEENKNWNRQQQKETIRGEIEKAEAAKTEAREGIASKYEAMMSQEALEHEARKLIVEGNEQEIVDLLKGFNPQWQDVGQSFGEKLINGLNSMKTPLANAVQEMVDIISSTKIVSSLGFDGGSMAAAVTNELRNVKVDLGNVKPVTGVFDAYAREMARMESVNVNTTIASAPVILDGRQIGVIDFDVIDTEAGNRANAKMRYSGVKV